MGRQSARLYYNGKDHSDIYYNGYNHSRMYLGNQLLWERLPPKFIFSGADARENIMTSEALESFSVFPNSFHNLGNFGKQDMAYAFGKYFIFLKVPLQDIQILIYSDNGYDWNILLKLDHQDKEFLGITNSSNELLLASNEKIYLIDSSLKIRDFIILDDLNRYDFAISKPRLSCKLIGNGETVIARYDSWYVIIIKNNTYIDSFEDIPNLPTVYSKKEGFFYKAGKDWIDYGVWKSKDGISWDTVTIFPNPVYSSSIYVANGYVYMCAFATPDMLSNIYIDRVKTNGFGYESKIIGADIDYPIKSHCCIDSSFYFTIDIFGIYHIYKIDNLFDSRIQKRSDLVTYGELKKKTDNSRIGFNYGICTDGNVDFQI